MLPVGNPAIGEDFVDREDEIKEIIESIQKDNILLVAPRRYGKTSIMRKIEEILNKKDYPTIFLDIYSVSTPEEFITELATAAFDVIKDKKSLISNLKRSCFEKLKGLDEVNISIRDLKFKFKRSLKKEINEENWKEKGWAIFTEIKKSFDQKFICFIIDEFSECVHNIGKKDKAKAEEFLKWFRSIRMSEKHLRFILSGSVSNDRVVRNITTLSTINDFKRVPIDGFKKKNALFVVKKVFEEEGWTYKKGIAEKIINCIGVPSVPYFLSAFLSVIQEEFDGETLNKGIIEDLYNNKLMGSHGKLYFDYYVQRLKIYYSYKEQKAAKSILKKLCQTGEILTEIAFDIFKKETGINNYEAFKDLISDLENDFYIKQKKNKIIFYSKVLEDWWRLYYA